ncbi:hypothetical protein PoB_002461100 [Plakobranchus ocellatus]|uniref:Uncharacterized protein n=1 Tax=Plakobranchus ocellatus TaxID=259542 RepID=A0AAV3ZFY8_9GAST|nr:hypothetical protein PoB_002461100 [Plakobranchus ocellatus]
MRFDLISCLHQLVGVVLCTLFTLHTVGLHHVFVDIYTEKQDDYDDYEDEEYNYGDDDGDDDDDDDEEEEEEEEKQEEKKRVGKGGEGVER